MKTPFEKLESLRTELYRELRADAQTLARDLDDKGEDTTPSQHPADVASDLYAREELAADERSIELELADVEDALSRVAHGTYGICIDCGDTIARERLAVLPQAARCISCQRDVERAARSHARA